MPTEKCDILVHYDEDGKRLIFYSVPTASTIGIRQQAFDGVCPEVEYFKALPAAEAEAKLGGLVFSILDLNSTNKIQIRDYESEAARERSLYMKELEVRAMNNDADAQYELSHYLHLSAMKNHSLYELERAESMLMAAVAQGHIEAKEHLLNWPTIKGAIERIISSSKST